MDDLLRDDAAAREAFRRGERWAMEAVYRSYLPLVRAVVGQGFGGFRGFASPADRDDAAQAIFAAAFEERARLAYDGLSPYGGFLRGIAHNVVRQILSKNQRFSRQPDAPHAEPPCVEASFLAGERARVLAAFRAQCTDAEREVLTRYFAEGWSEERLAEHLGQTRYRTRKTIAQLHKRMERHLRDHGFGRA